MKPRHSIENPFAPEKKRSKDDAELVGKILGPEAEAEYRKLEEGETKEQEQEPQEDWGDLEMTKEEKTKVEIEKSGIAEQYRSQLDILSRVGLLETLKSGELGITGINGQEYPVPTLETIAEKMEANKELLETKKEQGFTKLLLVPFGTKLQTLIDKYGEVIKKHHQAGTLKATNGDTLELDESTPVFQWDDYKDADTEGKLVYHPTQFTKEDHGGQTKQQILEESKEGFNVILIEDLPDLPAKGAGKEKGGRTQLEAGTTPKDYLTNLKEDPQYQAEQGLTPEDWLTYAITHLEEKSQVIDDYSGQGKGNWNLGGFFPSSQGVPRAHWYRGARQALLNRDDPADHDPYFGARSSVWI